eukprot:TRINITY_DN13906_c0_g1_i1.p1 TRINITY_DN13906_c0_g1~~TRINITY_DN13906_c0_g1_i1.p1  ORF type:complete len:845 (-),score=237.82 TRINITY_DN13906_c0_g1_i1:97-2631(-)
MSEKEENNKEEENSKQEDSPNVDHSDDSSDEEAQDADILLNQKVEDVDPEAHKKVESSQVRRDLNRFKSTRGFEEDETSPWFKERECLLLVLEARMLLKEMINLKLRQERVKNGDLSASEIQNLLRSQKEEQETDWITEIQELKRNLVSEVRRNHVLERDLNKLDKRIALLIKNRGNIQEVMGTSQTKKTKNQEIVNKTEFVTDPRKLEHYQNLFYLLQTEPKYLANLVYLMDSGKMESFLDTVILTLYGDAFSPREEYLILKLFQLSIQREMSAIKDVSAFLQADSVVPKMVIIYNRRKQGSEFLKNAFTPVVKNVISKDMNLELKPSIVYNTMINEMEISTGEKSQMDRNLTEDQIAELPKVKEIIKARVEQLEAICQQFVDAIIQNLSKLPYGIRWICKQIRLISQEYFANSSEDDILKVTGYFVYYRFINLAVVTPDAVNIVDRELTPQNRKNLISISKVLQNLFNFTLFGAGEKWFMPLNDFIKKNSEIVREYFTDLIEVADPDDYLQVDKYMELTQKTKPVIIISINEIVQTHQYLSANVDKLAKDKEDSLRLILNDLGEVPSTSKEDEREIQLTLTNRFKQSMEEEISASASLYAETKELIISTFRLIPVQASDQDQTLLGILNSGKKYAKDKGNKTLSSQIDKILENIKTLEVEQFISKADNYASFLRDIALEVANRAQIREQQRKEIKRLNQTLKNLRKHQKYLNEQIKQYNDYLQDCRLKHYQPKTKKKKSKGDNPNKIGPFKFSYDALQKKGVIIDSEVPVLSRKKTVFYISSEEVGVFTIVAKIAGLQVETMTLELDDLLERNYNNINSLELDQVILDVNFTIHLINKFFLK